MSQAVVEQIVGKLVMDKGFRTMMETNRDAALADFELTDQERANLAAMDFSEFNQGVAMLDERVSKIAWGGPTM